MAIRWSSIHEQLGITPRDLDYAMVQEAVSQHLPETESLDWKKSDPASVDQALDEVAKDVAVATRATADGKVDRARGHRRREAPSAGA
jgi:hypothetical protein